MKQKLIAFYIAALTMVACNNEKKNDSGNPSSENKIETGDTKPETPAGPPDSAQQAAMMKAWQGFVTPGDMHTWMAKHAGTWEGEMNQWMDPAAPPSKSKATETVKVLMNGLYLESDYSSNMMGMPMSGKSLMGYDKMKKMFVVSWIDNFGSGIVRMEGTYDDATKTLSLKGKQSDPGMGKETDLRQEQKWIDDNTYMLTMYGTGQDGKTEQKFMEGTFKRKK